MHQEITPTLSNLVEGQKKKKKRNGQNGALRAAVVWFGLVLDRDRSPYSYSAYHGGSGTSLWPGLDSGRFRP